MAGKKRESEAIQIKEKGMDAFLLAPWPLT